MYGIGSGENAAVSLIGSIAYQCERCPEYWMGIGKETFATFRGHITRAIDHSNHCLL